VTVTAAAYGVDFLRQPLYLAWVTVTARRVRIFINFFQYFSRFGKAKPQVRAYIGVEVFMKYASYLFHLLPVVFGGTDKAKNEKPPKGRKKRTDLKENAGKLFLNLGQLIFGTLFLGGVLRGEIPHYIMILVGIISAMILFLFGLLFTTKEKEE
jgi:hypothetical protein